MVRSLAPDMANSQQDPCPPYSSMNLNVVCEGKSGASEPSSSADRGAGVDSLAHPLTRPALLPSALSLSLSTDRLSKLPVQPYR